MTDQNSRFYGPDAHEHGKVLLRIGQNPNRMMATYDGLGPEIAVEAATAEGVLTGVGVAYEMVLYATTIWFSPTDEDEATAKGLQDGHKIDLGCRRLEEMLASGQMSGLWIDGEEITAETLASDDGTYEIAVLCKPPMIGGRHD